MADNESTGFTRRHFLTVATVVTGGVGAIATAVPFVSSFKPSARAQALGAPVEVDVPDDLPLVLADRLVRMFSFWGDTVLDPFAGTGTTLLAAARAERDAIGVEVDPVYFDLAVRTARSAGDLFLQPVVEVSSSAEPLAALRHG